VSNKGGLKSCDKRLSQGIEKVAKPDDLALGVGTIRIGVTQSELDAC